MKLANTEYPHGLTALLAATVVGCWSVAATAATGINEDCPETRAAIVAEISPPSVQVETVDHVSDPAISAAELATARPLDSSKGAQTSAQLRKALPSPADDGDSIGSDEDRSMELPATETRLPGIADEDLPRFRRQMFRTDI
jgi:hypothetical protein